MVVEVIGRDVGVRWIARVSIEIEKQKTKESETRKAKVE